MAKISGRRVKREQDDKYNRKPPDVRVWPTVTRGEAAGVYQL